MNTSDPNPGKNITNISELDFYKSAVGLFESALKDISTTHGGHKCNKIANKALSIYYGGIKAMVRRAGQTTQKDQAKDAETQENTHDNPYADGAFVGLGG